MGRSRARGFPSGVVMVEKAVTVKDGSHVVVRDMVPGDAQRSFEFFASLPEDDRRYLRVDVTRWDMVDRRTRELDSGRVIRLVADDGDAIVADGALELVGHGWGNNIAELRLIVARPYQRLGLGTIVARELYFLAAERKLRGQALVLLCAGKAAEFSAKIRHVKIHEQKVQPYTGGHIPLIEPRPELYD